MATGGTTQANQSVGAEAIIDAVVTNTPVFVRSSTATNSLAGSLVLNNIQLNNVPVAVGIAGGAVVLNGGTTNIASWGQGNVYMGTNTAGTFTKGNIVAANKPSVLLEGGRIFGRSHPQYEGYAPSQFISVKANGAAGDGRTDDTAALRNIFNTVRATLSSVPLLIIFSSSMRDARSSSSTQELMSLPLRSRSQLAYKLWEKRGLLSQAKEVHSKMLGAPCLL